MLPSGTGNRKIRNGSKKKKTIHKIVQSVFAAMDSSKKQRKRPRDCESDSSQGSTDDGNSDESEQDDDTIDVVRPPNFPVEDDGPNKILGSTQNPLNMTDVHEWLQHAEQGTSYSDKIMVNPPVKPKGGQILLYKCKRQKDHDHHRDQYFGFEMTGSNQSRPKQPVLKKYFKLKDSEGNYLNFERATYELKASAKKNDKVILIHYTGDHTIFQERPHGNSKSGRNYTATTTTNRQNIFEEVVRTSKGSQAIYDKLTKQIASTSEFKDREAVMGPRDTKQIQNIKNEAEVKSRLLRCEIFSAIEMGRNETLGRFIIRHVVNPYDMIIMAEPAALRFASKLLVEASRDPELPQYLCYDTTFNLADAYVSVLVMRNTFVVGDPITPIAFLIHERKLEAVHKEFFREMAELIDLEQLTQTVPIIFDRERGICNAIKFIIPGVKYIYCRNHILRDVKYWVQTAGGKEDDRKVLVGHIRHLLDCETIQEYDDYYDSVSPLWSQGFKEYFGRELTEDVKERGAKFYTNQFEAFKGKNATNNASESFNFIIKNRNEWKELRVDSLILALFNLQLSMLHEFERSFKSAGIGRYILKPQYKKFVCPLEVPPYMTWTESQFLEKFREGIYKPGSNVEKEGNYFQSRSLLAKLTCEQNLVSLDSRAAVFVITGIYNGKRAIVQRNEDGVLQCSCKSTGYCYHKLAVLYSLQIDISDDKESYSLSILKRKARGGKRTGRKVPSADDFITNVDPAPDSDLAKLKKRSELNEADREDRVSSDEAEGGAAQPDSSGDDVLVTSERENQDDDVLVTSERENQDDDDDSFQGIHHYSSSQFVEPSVGLELARASLTGSRSLSLDFELPDFLLLENVPASIPRIWTQNSTYQCLLPKRWLAEDILNDMTRVLITSLRLDEPVAFVNSHEFNVVRKAANSRYVSEALRCQGLNSDVLLINICMNNHILFAVVLYRPKKIVIIDSLPGLVTAEEIYKPLLLLVAATYFVGFVEFDVMEWRIITETEIPRQTNGYDCGVISIFNQYHMLRRQNFLQHVPSSDVLRRWILYCLHTTEDRGSLFIKRSKKVKRLVHEDKIRAEHLLTTLDIPDSDTMCQKASCVEQIAQELKICRRAWGPCAVDHCNADEDDTNYIMCAFCRRWFHLGSCIPYEEAKADYYLCSRCPAHRIRF